MVEILTYDIVGSIILIAVLMLQLFFLKYRIPLYIITVGFMGLVLNYFSLSSTIPYEPMTQMTFSLVHVLLIIHAARMARERM